MTKERQIAEYITGVLHGDFDHKAWLIEAGIAHCNGLPIPPARDGKEKKKKEMRDRMDYLEETLSKEQLKDYHQKFKPRDGDY